MPKLLLIDDEENHRNLLGQILTLEGFPVIHASTVQSGLEKLASEDVAVVITDVRLPDGNGIDLTAKIKSEFPEIEIIVLTAYGEIEDGVKAMKLGAFDYLTKGDENDKIILTVEKAFEKAELRRKLKSLEERVSANAGFGKIIGKSQEISEAIDLAEKVAPTETSVLLLGETGTGKELFAEAIHNSSKRRDKPFVAINCSAIPHNLQESELFGYKKGAFTGAMNDKKGIFETAHTGTLFLDEIGDMDLETQTKLLRALETKSFMRVGDTTLRNANVRIIAATHQDLEGRVEKGLFREDLFYRLNAFIIYLPPLRERKDDIPLLAQQFIADAMHKLEKKISGMDDEFKFRLIHYRWKGNIRELKNVIERAVILAPTDTLTVDLLPKSFSDEAKQPELIETNPNITLEELEKQHIQKVLSLENGNRLHAAKRLGIGTATLYRKLKEYGIKSESKE